MKYKSFCPLFPKKINCHVLSVHVEKNGVSRNKTKTLPIIANGAKPLADLRLGSAIRHIGKAKFINGQMFNRKISLIIFDSPDCNHFSPGTNTIWAY
ncbi:MAG: hypothetical protein MJ219_03150 [Mycoplasmoidaceae bacterium]|nr:hypothetical protein [Mycoplasmoidaceae bacterium]